MPGETVVRSSDRNLNIRLQSVTLQTESTRRGVFIRQMVGKQPKQRAALAKRQRLQTSSDMPIVQITDLEQSAGDTVTCDMFKLIRGKPFMGDRKMQGQGKPIKFSSMEVKIDQARFPIDAGGRMTNKRTRHNLRAIARANMADYFAVLNDEQIMIHLAGGRGQEYTDDWNIPLDDDEDFGEILINPVLAPTRNRRFIAGGGDSVTDIEETDALKLEDLDIIATYLRESPFPPMPIKVEKDPMGDEQPIWCLMVTERQWLYILSRAGANSSAWRKFVADAAMRARISKHPLFQGDTGLWNGLLVKKMPKPIRWYAGGMIKETQANNTERSVQVPPGRTVDRAIILGGQALAIAKGDAGGGTAAFPMRWSEELTDHGNALEIGAGQMDGKAKFRFKGTDDVWTDFGCATIDSYAPDPRTEAGMNLITALQSQPATM